MARFLRTICIVLALFVAGTATTATACPMCKNANETNLNPGTENRPKAYMYSILFMLAMPASIFTGFGVTFYRLSKQQQAINEGLSSTETTV